MPVISIENKVPTVILVFKVETGKQNALINAAVDNSQKVMEKKPGFISASLHKSFDGTSMVNYAQWENRKSYEDAINFLIPEEIKIGEKIFDLVDPDWNVYELVFSSGSTPVTISKTTQLVTVINLFIVEPKNLQKLIDELKELSKKFVEKQPGFISANVHQSFDRKRVISYAQWKTQEDYKSIYVNIDAKPFLDKLKKISKFNWNLYEVVYTSSENSHNSS